MVSGIPIFMRAMRHDDINILSYSPYSKFKSEISFDIYVSSKRATQKLYWNGEDCGSESKFAVNYTEKIKSETVSKDQHNWKVADL